MFYKSQKFEPYEQLWTQASNIVDKLAMWQDGPLHAVQSETLDKDVMALWREIFKLSKKLAGSAAAGVAELLLQKLDQYKPNIPLVIALCNPGMRDRHWVKVAEIVGFELHLDEYVTTLLISIFMLIINSSMTLSRLLGMNVMQHLRELETVSENASREYGLERALQKMYAEWKDVVCCCDFFFFFAVAKH